MSPRAQEFIRAIAERIEAAEANGQEWESFTHAGLVNTGFVRDPKGLAWSKKAADGSFNAWLAVKPLSQDIATRRTA